MKEIYENPTMEIMDFGNENILTDSVVSLNDKNYNVVSDGIGFSGGGTVQSVTGSNSTSYTFN